MRTLLLFSSFLLFIKTYSQTNFISKTGTAGGEEIYGVTQSADGNYLATGWSVNNDDDGDTYVVKLNSTGQQVWSKIVGTDDYDEGYGIVNTSDGGFAISGAIANKMAITKFDASGNISWAKQYLELTESDATNLLQTSDGGYLLPGGISSDDFNSSNAYLVKTDASGNVQWAKKYFTSYYSAIFDLKKTSDGNYVFVSMNYSSDDDNDSAYIVKINSNGNVVWSKYFYSDEHSVDGYRITPLSDGDYLVTGEAWNSDDDNGFILKLDGNGNYKWSKSTNFTSSDFRVSFYDIVETSDGGCAAIGYLDDYTSLVNYTYVVKLSSTGSPVWTKLLSYTDSYADIRRLIKTTDGGYLSAGEIYTDGDDSYYGLFTKFDANFNTCITSVSEDGIQDFGTLATGTVTVYSGSPTVTNIALSVSSLGSATNICSVLPLTLLDFNAESKANAVSLKWRTSEERNTNYFDVEKSMDGKTFAAFTHVAAAGNSTSITSYNTADNNPFKGDSWYRLKMVDKDGQYAYSNIAKVSFAGQSKTNIYPNPAINNATIIFNTSRGGNYSIRVTDMSGKLLQTLKGTAIVAENRITLDVSGYAKGAYIVEITNEDGKTTLKLNKL